MVEKSTKHRKMIESLKFLTIKVRIKKWHTIEIKSCKKWGEINSWLSRCILLGGLFYYPASSGIASYVGTAGTVTWHLHLKRPCCVALGWVLIWVVSPDWFEELCQLGRESGLVWGSLSIGFPHSQVEFYVSPKARCLIWLSHVNMRDFLSNRIIC